MAKVAVVGGGAAGIGAAVQLVKAGMDVTLVDAAPRLGGHCSAVTVTLWDQRTIKVDAGHAELNPVTSPSLLALFGELDVRLEPINADIAFATPDRTPLWFTRVGKPLFRRRPEDANKLLAEIGRFHGRSVEVLDDPTYADWSTARYIESQGYSADFRPLYLEPRARSLLWLRDASLERVPVRALVTALRLMGIVGHEAEPRQTISGGMHTYAEAVERFLRDRRVEVLLATRVAAITRLGDSVRLRLVDRDGASRLLSADHVVVAAGATDVVAMLEDAQEDEVRAFAPVETQRLRQVVHLDQRLLPADRATWGAWNFTTQQGETHPTVTVYVNRHQNLPASIPDVFVSINPGIEPEPAKVIVDRVVEHPVIAGLHDDSREAIDSLQGRRRTWFCGSYLRPPFTHEQAFQSGKDVADRVAAAVADASRRFEAGLPVSQGGYDSFLREIPMLAGLDGDALAELQLNARPFSAEPGQVLFRQGEAPDGFYLVKRGTIDISRRVPGDRMVRIARRDVGSVVGELGLLDGTPRSATAIAAEPTAGYFIGAEAFAALRADMRGPAFAVMSCFRRELAARARAAIAETCSLSLALDPPPAALAPPRAASSPVGSGTATSIGLDAIAALPVLRSFRRAELPALIEPLRQRVYDRGSAVIDAGAPPRACLIVLRGALSLHFASDRGQTVFSLLGPGRMAGEIALIDGGPEPLACVAREDTVVLEIDKISFDILRRGGTTVALKLFEAVTASAAALLRRASAHRARLDQSRADGPKLREAS